MESTEIWGDLRSVRRKLEQMSESRLGADFTPQEMALYERLCLLEVRLLADPAA